MSAEALEERMERPVEFAAPVSSRQAPATVQASFDALINAVRAEIMKDIAGGGHIRIFGLDVKQIAALRIFYQRTTGKQPENILIDQANSDD